MRNNPTRMVSSRPGWRQPTNLSRATTAATATPAMAIPAVISRQASRASNSARSFLRRHFGEQVVGEEIRLSPRVRVGLIGRDARLLQALRERQRVERDGGHRSRC